MFRLFLPAFAAAALAAQQPPAPGGSSTCSRGSLVRGSIVGLMFMEDEKGVDSKVVVSVAGTDGTLRDALTRSEQRRIGDYFNPFQTGNDTKYKQAAAVAGICAVPVHRGR